MENTLIDDVRVLLEDRSAEVLRQLQFAEVLSKAKGLARRKEDGSLALIDFTLDRDLIKSVRASGYLLIYNQIEAVMTAALNAIHYQLEQENRQFEDLSSEVKEICLKNFKSAVKSFNTDSALIHKSLALNECMVSLGYSKRNHWNGNIDAKEVYAKAKKYGFEVAKHNREDSKNGENLNKVKNKRNELGHGELSFVQCGHDTAIENLFDYQREATVFLTAVLDGIEDYLLKQHYLVRPPLDVA